MIELRKVTKRYAASQGAAVSDVSLTIERGEFFSLLGPSGCGKSTTLRMIAGLESISDGELFVDGAKVNDVPARDRDMAMVFQSYALYPHMNVYDNLAFGLRRRGFARDEINRRVRDAAAMLGLTEFVKRKPHALSGGQRQRVALGRAIVRDPKVFLFDEPLSNLDAALRTSMRSEIIRQHRRMGATMVYVTHDQAEAMTMSDRLCIMDRGEVIQIGRPIDVYRHPRTAFVARFLGSPPMNLMDGMLESDSSGPVVRLGELVLPLPRWSEADLSGRIGTKVILGVRPEHLRDDTSDAPNAFHARLRCLVQTVEPLGAETLLTVSIGAVILMARVGAETRACPDETVELAVRTDELHLFDPATSLAFARAS